MNPHRALIALPAFASSPFPLRGGRSAGGRAFFDQTEGTRRGRTTRHGQVCWEDETYNDKRVLLAIPDNFDNTRAATLVVFLHGNRARLERDVITRQQVVRQVHDAHINAVLVAPQFALDAPDSSAGRFAVRGVFRSFLDEAAQQLAHLCRQRAPTPTHVFERASVIVVAYSGGYCPAAAALTAGQASARVRGVVLLDALYDHEALFAAWLQRRRQHAFLVSAYTHSTRPQNLELRALLKQRAQNYTLGLTDHLVPGSVCLVPLDGAVEHAEVVTRAWCVDPLSDVLRRAGHGLDLMGTRARARR